MTGKRACISDRVLAGGYHSNSEQTSKQLRSSLRVLVVAAIITGYWLLLSQQQLSVLNSGISSPVNGATADFIVSALAMPAPGELNEPLLSATSTTAGMVMSILTDDEETAFTENASAVESAELYTSTTAVPPNDIATATTDDEENTTLAATIPPNRPCCVNSSSVSNEGGGGGDLSDVEYWAIILACVGLAVFFLVFCVGLCVSPRLRDAICIPQGERRVPLSSTAGVVVGVPVSSPNHPPHASPIIGSNDTTTSAVFGSSAADVALPCCGDTVVLTPHVDPYGRGTYHAAIDHSPIAAEEVPRSSTTNPNMEECCDHCDRASFREGD